MSFIFQESGNLSVLVSKRPHFYNISKGKKAKKCGTKKEKKKGKKMLGQKSALPSRVAIAYSVNMSSKCLVVCLVLLTRHFNTRHQTLSNQILDTLKQTLDTFKQTLDTRHFQLGTRHFQVDTRHFQQGTRHFQQDTRHFSLLNKSTRHLQDTFNIIDYFWIFLSKNQKI